MNLKQMDQAFTKNPRISFSSLMGPLCILIIMCGCSGGTGPSDSTTKNSKSALEGYTLKDQKEGLQLATKIGSLEKLSEQGIVVNGSKEGAWLTYHENSDMVATIANYVNGELHGIYCEVDTRGQLKRKINYEHGKKEGSDFKFRYGRINEESYYRYGKLDGTQKIFYQTGKIQQMINYVNGMKEGTAIYYDAEGNVTSRYEYEGNEIINGGKVDK